MSLVFVPGVIGILLGGSSSGGGGTPPGTVPDFDFCDKDSPVAGFYVITADNCPNTLRWCLLEHFEVDSFQIYKSFVGFVTGEEAPFSGLRKGDTLKLRVNNQELQKVVFKRNDYSVQEIIDLLNDNLEGVTVSKMTNTDQLIFRSNCVGEGSFIEVFGGSALSKMGIEKRTISEKSEFILWSTVDNETFEYADVDGDQNDHYYIASVYDEEIYRRSTVMSPTKYRGNICVIEGFLYGANGVRVQDVEVTAKVVVPPEQYGSGGYITEDEISYRSDENGRFSLPVLQGSLVLFEVNKARISDPVTVPEQAFVFFDKLSVDDNYRFKDLEN
jgi:hypothetical protein